LSKVKRVRHKLLTFVYGVRKRVKKVSIIRNAPANWVSAIGIMSRINARPLDPLNFVFMTAHGTDIFPEKNRTFADPVWDERPPQKMSTAREQIFSSVGAALAPWHHIALVSHAEIHRTIADALAAMPDDPNLSWVTGPSKTADVEGILIQSVQACLII